MKKLTVHITIMMTLGLLATASLPAGAETLFLRDGSLVEGTIITNTAYTIVIKTDRGRQKFKSKEILRIAHDDNFRSRVYLYMKDNTVKYGHITGEDRDVIYFRKDLSQPGEQKIARENIAFKSTKKIRELEEPPVIVNGTRDMFRNMLGFRITTGLSIAHTVPVTATNFFLRSWPAGIALFYYDRYFGLDMEFFPEIGGVSGQSFIMTFLPFNSLHVPLGIQLGYFSYREFDESGSRPIYYSPEPHRGIGIDPYTVRSEIGGTLLGLTWRLPNLLRFGVAYIFDFNGGFNLLDRNLTQFEYSGTSEWGINIYSFIEFWVYKGLSVRVAYLHYEKYGYSDIPPAGITSHLTIDNNIIFLSVGYAFSLRDK